jgi:hypothetical protein
MEKPASIEHPGMQAEQRRDPKNRWAAYPLAAHPAAAAADLKAG